MNTIRQILNEDRENTEPNFLKLKSAYDFQIQYLIDSKRDKFLTVDLLIRVNNIIIGSQNTHLRTHNVRTALCNKYYMEHNKIETALYTLVDNFNDRRITHKQFVRLFLDQIHPFADGNGRTSKILFADKLA